MRVYVLSTTFDTNNFGPKKTFFCTYVVILYSALLPPLQILSCLLKNESDE